MIESPEDPPGWGRLVHGESLCDHCGETPTFRYRVEDDMGFTTSLLACPACGRLGTVPLLEGWRGLVETPRPPAGLGAQAGRRLRLVPRRPVRDALRHWYDKVIPLGQAGRLAKAIEFNKQLVADNPRDWNTIKKIGDLYARMNRNKEAAQEYAKVAEFFAKDGFLLKAIAVWKQIQKLDPSGLDAYVGLADLYAKQGLLVEAKGQYQIVVDENKKRGKIKDAREALRKMAEIDPDDLKVQSVLADLYVRDGNSEKAIEVHITIARSLDKKGHLADQVLEKGLRIDPNSAKLRAELSRLAPRDSD